MSPITARWMALLAAGLLAAACARSPEAQKARHLEHGDRYVQREQFREAIIEYRNVLRFDQNNGHAMRQLGLAHYQLGELAQAYQYLLKAQELAPHDLNVRLKLGTIYALSGKLAEARAEAELILAREPGNTDGLVLLGSVVRTPRKPVTPSGGSRPCEPRCGIPRSW